MSEIHSVSLRERQMALLRWDDEGGAGPAEPQGATVSILPAQSRILNLTNAELVQLGAVHSVMLDYVDALRRRSGRTEGNFKPLPIRTT